MEALTKRKYSRIVLTGIGIFQTFDIFLMSSYNLFYQKVQMRCKEARKGGSPYQKGFVG
jgi:hypothetical protein